MYKDCEGRYVILQLETRRAEGLISKLGDLIYLVVCISPAVHCNGVSFLNFGRTAPYPHFSEQGPQMLMHNNI